MLPYSWKGPITNLLTTIHKITRRPVIDQENLLIYLTSVWVRQADKSSFLVLTLIIAEALCLLVLFCLSGFGTIAQAAMFFP